MVQVTDIDLAARTVHYLGEGSGHHSLRRARARVRPERESRARQGHGALRAAAEDARRRAVHAQPRDRAARASGAAAGSRAAALAHVVRRRSAAASAASKTRAGSWTFCARAGVTTSARSTTSASTLVHSGDRLLPELSRVARRVRRAQDARARHRRASERARVRVDDRGIMLERRRDTSTAGTVICTIGTAPNPLIADSTAAEESRPTRGGARHVGAGCARRVGARRLRGRAERARRQRLAADGAVRRAPSARSSRRTSGAQTARRADAAVSLSPDRSAGRDRPQQSGRGDLRHQARRIRRLAAVARRVSAARFRRSAAKVRLFLEWNWAMFFPPDISHLGYARTRRAPASADESAQESSRAPRAAA